MSKYIINYDKKAYTQWERKKQQQQLHRQMQCTQNAPIQMLLIIIISLLDAFHFQCKQYSRGYARCTLFAQLKFALLEVNKY